MKRKQKFFRGDLVRLADKMPISMSHFEAGGKALVLGSYNDKYGGGDIDSYTLLLLDRGPKKNEDYAVSWYYEKQLTLRRRATLASHERIQRYLSINTDE